MEKNSARKQSFFRLAFTLLVACALLTPQPAHAMTAQPEVSASPATAAALSFTSAGQVVQFSSAGLLLSNGQYALRVGFVGANPVAPQSAATPAGGGGLAGKLPALTQVSYTNLWNGIDLSFDPGGGVARSTYRLAPGADPAAIRLHYNRPLSILADGSLELAFEGAVLRESAPIAWQMEGEQRTEVPVHFVQPETGSLGFALGAYDRARPLWIDPTLSWNTFFGQGGTGIEDSKGMVADASGNIYLVGTAYSGWSDSVAVLPYTTGADAFVAKLDSSGNLVWHTFLGGAATDNGYSIALDGSGNVYVAGSSTSTWGTPARAYTAGTDAFVARLDASGSLTWLTFLGAAGVDYGYGVAVDGSGNVYVAGSSTSTWGAPVQAISLGSDGFVAQLNNAGALTWNTFLGGTSTDTVNGIALDGSGNVYVVGTSGGSWGTPQRAFTVTGTRTDAFVAKLNSAGARTWNTFLGGTGNDLGNALAVDGIGNVYAGGTASATWGAPVAAFSGLGVIPANGWTAKLSNAGTLTWNTFVGMTTNSTILGLTLDAGSNLFVTGRSTFSWGSPVYPETYTASTGDGYAAKLDSDGALIWNTFLGGVGDDFGRAIVVTGAGSIYVTGDSTVTWGAPLRAFHGLEFSHPYAARLDADSNRLWSTFLGDGADIGNNSLSDQAYAVAVDGSGNVFTAGRAFSRWSVGTPVRAFSGGESDAFVAKFDANGNLLWHTFLGGAESDVARALALDASGSLYVGGYSSLGWGAPVRAYSSPGYDAFAAKLAGDGTLTWNTFLGSSAAEDYANGIAVDGSGNVSLAGTSGATWGTPVRAFTTGIPYSDAFAARLDSSGALTWNTFLGSANLDHGNALGLDGSGNVYLAGDSALTWGTPLIAYTFNGDAFIAKLDGAGGLVWHTFLGGSQADAANAVTLDGSGNIYVAGTSGDTWGTPVRAFSGIPDAFAAKFNAAGALTWNTFLGVNVDDAGCGVAVDGSGNVYVTGSSSATWGTPVRTFSGVTDAMLTKLDSAGALTWNAFLGGSATDHGYALAVDSNNVYVAGDSQSTWGAPVMAYNGGYDSMVTKLTNTGTLTWNAFLGSSYASANDYTYGMTQDAAGNLYLTGQSGGTWGTPLRPFTGGTCDAYLVKLNSSGQRVWLTFLGGTGDDQGNAVTVDSSGNVYVAGTSQAVWGAPAEPYSGGADAFVAKVDASSGSLVWNTFLGSSGSDVGNAITLDGSGGGIVAGTSLGTWGAPLRAYSGTFDGFVARVATSDGSLIWNTFLGGAGTDYLWSVAMSAGSVMVGGTSGAAWSALPMTPINAYTASNDGLVAKLDGSGNLTWFTFLGGTLADTLAGLAVDDDGNIDIVGSSAATWGTPRHAYAVGTDGFVAQVSASGSLNWNTFLGGTGADNLTAISVSGTSIYITGDSNATWGAPVQAYAAGIDALAAKLSNAGELAWSTFLGSLSNDNGKAISLNTGGQILVAGHSTRAWGTRLNDYIGSTDGFVATLGGCLESAASGNWNNPAAWVGGSVPAPGSEVCLKNGHTLTLDISPALDSLQIEPGAALVMPTGFGLTAESLASNLGSIIQTRTLNNSTLPFAEIKNAAGTATFYRGLEIGTANDLGSVAAVVRHLAPGAYCTDSGLTSPAYTRRCFQITPTHNLPATLTLYGDTFKELESILPANLAIYHGVPPTTWTQQTSNATTGAAGAFSYARADVVSFSSYLLGAAGNVPTALRLTLFQAAPPESTLLLVLLLGLVALLACARGIGGKRPII